MNRQEVELFLVYQEFPAYTQDIRLIVSGVRHLDEAVITHQIAKLINERHKRLIELWIRARKGDLQFGDMIHPLKGEQVLLTYFKKAIEYERKVSTLSAEDLRDLYFSANEKRRVIEKELADEKDRFAWFNEPDADLQLEYWSEFPLFTPDEVVAITFNKDPRRVDFEKLTSWAGRDASSFLTAYADRLRQVERIANARKPRLSTPLKLDRKDIETWMRDNQICEGVFLYKANTLPVAEEKDLGTKESHSLYRIILGLLMEGKFVDASTPTSFYTTKLHKDLSGRFDNIGIPLTEKTLIKHLKLVRDYALACSPPLIRPR